MFVYQPALLLIGTPVEIAVSTLTATIGLSFVAVGFVGYLGGPLAGPGRLTVLAGGLMMIVPELPHRSRRTGAGRPGSGPSAAGWPAPPGAAVRRAPRCPARGPARGPARDPARSAALMQRRLAAARREEGDDPATGPAADASGPGADLDRLLEERGAPGGVEEHPGRRLLWGWLAIGALAVAMETMGPARAAGDRSESPGSAPCWQLAAALATLLPLLLRGGGPPTVEEQPPLDRLRADRGTGADPRQRRPLRPSAICRATSSGSATRRATRPTTFWR